jgi:hypothetical protein
MAAATKRIQLHPSGPPRTLARPAGFRTSAISVGFSGDAIRLLANEESADAVTARVEQPGWASFPRTHTDNEYSSIISVSGHSGSRDTRLYGLTATFPQRAPLLRTGRQDTAIRLPIAAP